MITLAEHKDLDEIVRLTQQCARDMISKGIFQWNEEYPSREKLENDINSGELYCIKVKEEIAGIIVITETEDIEYKDVKWLGGDNFDANPVYIHRLAVLPKFQSMGYAQQLMDFAESFAQAMGYTSVRLDTFSQNERNNRFYGKRGYKKLEDIYFPKQSTQPFHCYELLLEE